MASRRHSSRGSGRRKPGMGTGRLLMASALLIGLGAGGWLFFNGKGDALAETGIGELITNLNASGDDEPAPAMQRASSLAEVQRVLTTVASALHGNGETREESLHEGYKRLSGILEGPLPIEERERAIKLFHSITDELFLSPVHNEFSENYVVRRGDSYARIAGGRGISVNLLWDLNNRPRGHTALHPGENLKVPKGQPSLVVRKADFTASLYLGENLVRQYIIAHGQNDNTPVGTTTINSMTIDPEKSSRGPNDPVNEMKLRWIGWASYAGGRSGFGFHGTQYPDSIPGMTSRGCIRMKDSDVIELYDIVRIGNKVEVRA
jgi:hypothetical protein